jgi:hypothetical protein
MELLFSSKDFLASSMVLILSMRFTYWLSIRNGSFTNYRLVPLLVWFLAELSLGTAMIVGNGWSHPATIMLMFSPFLLIPSMYEVIKRDGWRLGADDFEKWSFRLGIPLFVMLILVLVIQPPKQYQLTFAWITIVVQLLFDLSGGVVQVRNAWSNPWGENLWIHSQVILLNLFFFIASYLESKELISFIVPLILALVYDPIFFIVLWRRRIIKKAPGSSWEAFYFNSISLHDISCTSFHFHMDMDR